MATLERSVPRSKSARFNEIVNILIRHDFWGMLRAMLRAPAADGADAPARLRGILEELGPTFIKIGQLLATRPDLVPAAYVEEFKKLYDKTQPGPFSDVKAVVERELGCPLRDAFRDFDEVALASASVGQVHRATLKDGTPVAVKVQHVGIEEAMLLDFEILRGLLKFIEKTFAASRVWQPTRHLDELRHMLERELDYRYEMKHTKRVAHNFRHDERVHIPAMFPELCTKRVMVMEYIDGIKFTRADDPQLHGIDRPNIARIVTQAMGQQIFIHRFFHADPSPGNMMILDSNKVAFLDFGAVGAVTERRAKNILKLITGVAKGDVDGTAEAVIDLCDQKGEYDQKRFVTDVEKILDYFEREEVSVADPKIMELILGLATEHRMLLPPDFILINRALFQFDGFCRELDPDFDLVETLEPLVAELVWKHLASPKKQKELVEETLGELLRFTRTFPHTLNQLVRRIERNEFTTRIELSGMEGMKSAQGRSFLKQSFSIMMAALIIGLAIVYTGPDPAVRANQYLFGVGAILVAWILVMVLWSESFKGRRE